MAEETAARRVREKAIDDLWNRTLAQVPTTFGRIVYLASLRNSNTGRYEHFGLAQVYTPEEADRALSQSHGRVFRQWLNFQLAQQRSDLEDYLDSLQAELAGDRETVLRAWAALSPYRNLLPTGAGEAEKTLFLSDLELILRLLQGEVSACGPTPGA